MRTLGGYEIKLTAVVDGRTVDVTESITAPAPRAWHGPVIDFGAFRRVVDRHREQNPPLRLEDRVARIEFALGMRP